MKASLSRALCLVAAMGLSSLGCDAGRAQYPTAEGSLGLSRVVLYRNGIGYFERVGNVDGNVLTIKVRKDQVNDLLKSLTVVEREGGRAVSVSMPLDPQTWANAALSTLSPGRGSLAEVLDALRGTEVTLTTTEGTISGRIALVEALESEPSPAIRMPPQPEPPAMRDHRITLLHEGQFLVARLSQVRTVALRDGDLAMQFNRTLDATAGEGMFQQVDVAIRLVGEQGHDLLVSYVVAAPMWKPTYRVVLPKEGKGKALLQGWAVVDNTSGEDWRQVTLGLTSGAPIAFRYDLHTPRDVFRSDLTETGVRKQARATTGETTYDYDGAEDKKVLEEAEAERWSRDEADDASGYYDAPMGGAGRSAAAPAPMMKSKERGPMPPPASKPDMSVMPAQAPSPVLDFESLQRSTLAQARAVAVSGLSRFDLEEKVTVPDGTSTMVAIINAAVEGEETFLFKPGGAGTGYEANPYRVVRFKNSTPFVLEPGPISIYAGGSFVGEGLSDSVGTMTSATIPFAVEPSILVSSTTKYENDEAHVLRIVRGVLEIESFARTTTTWTVKAPTMDKGVTVLVRHPKTGYNYELKVRPEKTEDLPDAYLIPITVATGSHESSLDVIEQTPSRTSISIWEGRAIPLLESLLISSEISAENRAKLDPIVKKRQEIGRIDTKIQGLTEQRSELDQRASETRQNLLAIKKDPAAGALRARLSERLEQFTQDGDRLGREIVELSSKRLELKIELDDALQNLDLRADEKPKAPVGKAPAR